jgi:hypothetical protein
MIVVGCDKKGLLECVLVSISRAREARKARGIQLFLLLVMCKE